MNRLALPIALALLSTDALAQAATEVYIPIGRSPGVSGVTSTIGTVESVEPFIVAGRLFRFGFNTIVYLDRTNLKCMNRINTVGSIADLEVGLLVEVKPRRENAAVADWIKIDVPKNRR